MAMQSVREGLLSAPQISWWSAFGSQSLSPESLSGDSNSFAGVTVRETDQVVDSTQSIPPTHLAFSLGDVKSSRVVPKPHGVVASSMQSPCLELGFTQRPRVIFVNSKQYHGILRRRQSRAKAASVLDQNKLTSRFRKPYMHHSRHVHALRRPRGSGGRFLNTKSQNKTNAKKADATNLSNGYSVLGSEVTSMNYFLSGMVMPSKWIDGCCNFKN